MKTYTNLPVDHSRLKLVMIADFLDRWKGESLLVKIDGQIVIQHGHDWC